MEIFLIILLLIVAIAVFLMMRSSKAVDQRREFKSNKRDDSRIGTRRETGSITRLRLIPRKFDPDGDATDFMWYGLTFEAQDGSRVAYDDNRLKEIGCGVFNVAGVSHRKTALQKECFAPGSLITLLPEDNPHDKDAVAVWDENRLTQVGYVPRETAKKVRKALEDNATLALIVAHAVKGRKRVSLTVLYGPLAGLISR